MEQQQFTRFLTERKEATRRATEDVVGMALSRKATNSVLSAVFLHGKGVVWAAEGTDRSVCAT
jgi:hypothetical protein